MHFYLHSFHLLTIFISHIINFMQLLENLCKSFILRSQIVYKTIIPRLKCILFYILYLKTINFFYFWSWDWIYPIINGQMEKLLCTIWKTNVTKQFPILHAIHNGMQLNSHKAKGGGVMGCAKCIQRMTHNVTTYIQYLMIDRSRRGAAAHRVAHPTKPSDQGSLYLS